MNYFHQADGRYRLAIVVVSAVVLVASLVQIYRLPVNSLPNLSPVSVEIQTEAFGLSAPEVEAMITVPLEADMLNGIPWLDRLQSRSITGLSSIDLIFEPRTDLMAARQMVQERLTAAHALPNVSKPPLMRQPVATEGRVAQIGLTSDTLSLIDLSVLAYWTIRPRLLSVPGVANISIWGERARQMQILVDPDKARAAGVKLDDVIRTAGNSMWVSPLSYLDASTPGTGGFIDTPNQRLGIQHVFPVAEPDEMKGIVLADGSGRSLGSVADVVEGHQPLIGDALINGKPGLLLVVEKFPWSGTQDVVNGIEAALSGLSPGLKGIDVTTGFFRAGDGARGFADALRLASLVGAILASVVIAVTTLRLRVAGVAIFSAGTAVLAATAFAVYLATPVNAVTFAGLAVAAAIILKDALNGAPPALSGGKTGRSSWTEAYGDVLRYSGFTTASALLVSVPFLALNGINGAVAREMTAPFMIALGTSFVVAYFVLPAAVRIVARGEASDDPAGQSVTGRASGLLKGKALGPTTGFAVLALLVAAGVAALATAEMPSARKEYTRDMLVEWRSPPGASIKAVLGQGKALSDALLADDMIDQVALQVGRAEHSDEVLNANAATIWLSLAEDVRPSRAAAGIEAIANGIDGIDASVLSYRDRQLSRSGLLPDKTGLRVRVYGHEYGVLATKAQEVAEALSGISGIQRAEVVPVQTEPVLEIDVDLEAARVAGIKPGEIRRATAVLLAGIEVGSLFEDQKIFDVVVWGTRDIHDSVEAVSDILIATPDGHVRLADVADVRISDSPSFINRNAVSRFVDVVLDTGRSGASLVSTVEDRLQVMDFPLEYHAEVVGGSATRTQSEYSILQVGAATLIGALLLMQACFGSWSRAAFTILFGLAVAGSAVLVTVLSGLWSVAASVGVLAAFAAGLRDATTVLSHPDRGWCWPVLASNVAVIAALLPVLFVPVLFGGSAGFGFATAGITALGVGVVVSTLMAFLIPVNTGMLAAENTAPAREDPGHAV